MDAIDLLRELSHRGQTLATAESLTGGRLAARVTTVAGASAVYLGGIVAYATPVKVALLGVPERLVEEHGVISPECARAMAEGARHSMAATFAISTTGVAGPDPQEDEPPGTVFVAVAGPGGVQVRALTLGGSREEVQERTCDEAFAALGRILHGEEPGLR